MFILLLLSVPNPSSSIPLAPSSVDTSHVPSSIFGREHSESADVTHYRAKQDIIWSCLATIFACVWVAVHPNLPGPRDSGWTTFKRKAVTMIYAMIAPEFMAAWALRQWIAARWIVREFNNEEEKNRSWYWVFPSTLKEGCVAVWASLEEWFRGPTPTSKGWTLTHGFLVQMGGFILYNGDIPLRVLTFGDLKKLIDEDKADAPEISEDEINDKSKGDFLAKLFVVLQTSWFLFQCFARWTLHLPVTELEVVTLAFAVLNVVIYALWWKKPLGVLVAIRVQLKHHSNEGDGAQGDDPGGHRNQNEELLKSGVDEKESFITQKMRKTLGDAWAARLIWIPLRLVQAMLRPLNKMWSSKTTRQSLRVPMFYADKTNSKEDLPFAVISTLFGCLHLIPWSSFLSFPSVVELWLWRSATIIIIAEPIAFYLGTLVTKFGDRFATGWIYNLLWTPLVVISILGAPLYILARFTLLILAFTTLRKLSPGAYIAIEWTTFVPHI